MVKVEETTQGVLDKISEGFAQKGAFNLRQNGISICQGDKGREGFHPGSGKCIWNDRSGLQ